MPNLTRTVFVISATILGGIGTSQSTPRAAQSGLRVLNNGVVPPPMPGGVQPQLPDLSSQMMIRGTNRDRRVSQANSGNDIGFDVSTIVVITVIGGVSLISCFAALCWAFCDRARQSRPVNQLQDNQHNLPQHLPRSNVTIHVPSNAIPQQGSQPDSVGLPENLPVGAPTGLHTSTSGKNQSSEVPKTRFSVRSSATPGMPPRRLPPPPEIGRIVDVSDEFGGIPTTSARATLSGLDAGYAMNRIHLSESGGSVVDLRTNAQDIFNLLPLINPLKNSGSFVDMPVSEVPQLDPEKINDELIKDSRKTSEEQFQQLEQLISSTQSPRNTSDVTPPVASIAIGDPKPSLPAPAQDHNPERLPVSTQSPRPSQMVQNATDHPQLVAPSVLSGGTAAPSRPQPVAPRVTQLPVSMSKGASVSPSLPQPGPVNPLPVAYSLPEAVPVSKKATPLDPIVTSGYASGPLSDSNRGLSGAHDSEPLPKPTSNFSQPTAGRLGRRGETGELRTQLSKRTAAAPHEVSPQSGGPRETQPRAANLDSIMSLPVNNLKLFPKPASQDTSKIFSPVSPLNLDLVRNQSLESSPGGAAGSSSNRSSTASVSPGRTGSSAARRAVVSAGLMSRVQMYNTAVDAKPLVPEKKITPRKK